MSMPTTVEREVAPPSHRATLVTLGLVAALGLFFIVVAALPYFSLDETRFGPYWPRRWWLLAHVTTGIVALMAGPVQLWLGFADRRVEVHRRLGVIYVSAVVLSAIAAYYLAWNTSGGWGFGSGLAGLATAWLITTGMAWLAIRRQLFDQHKEWMVRSYVVTTGFVSFRIFQTVLERAGVGTTLEQLAIAAWFCWSVPLLITEAVLQGRKVLAVRR
jgi:uncharacterized membrane protein